MATDNTKQTNQETAQGYSAKNLEVLEGLDAVRMRPGMYIGSTGIKGLHHILWEIVDNAIDEAANGFADKITVKLYKDGSASVEDTAAAFRRTFIPKKRFPACRWSLQNCMRAANSARATMHIRAVCTAWRFRHQRAFRVAARGSLPQTHLPHEFPFFL